MTVGELIHVKKECQARCVCIFCQKKSSRVGLIVESWVDENDELSYMAEFDFGLWSLWSHTFAENNIVRL